MHEDSPDYDDPKQTRELREALAWAQPKRLLARYREKRAAYETGMGPPPSLAWDLAAERAEAAVLAAATAANAALSDAYAAKRAAGGGAERQRAWNERVAAEAAQRKARKRALGLARSELVSAERQADAAHARGSLTTEMARRVLAARAAVAALGEEP